MGKQVEEVEIARFYTRSRRFPKMIGRMHDGTKIPGGPYTVTQAAIGGAVFLIAITTRTKWGTGTILVDIPIAVGIAWGFAWLAGRIPATRRNLLSVAAGAAGAMFKPVEGKYRGAPIRIRAPHGAFGRVHVGAVTDEPRDVAQVVSSVPSAVSPTLALSAALEAPVTAAARPAIAQTAVERLLEQSRTK